MGYSPQYPAPEDIAAGADRQFLGCLGPCDLWFGQDRNSSRKVLIINTLGGALAIHADILESRFGPASNIRDTPGEWLRAHKAWFNDEMAYNLKFASCAGITWDALMAFLRVFGPSTFPVIAELNYAQQRKEQQNADRRVRARR